jgi:hypothetical protein
MQMILSPAPASADSRRVCGIYPKPRIKKQLGVFYHIRRVMSRQKSPQK